MPNRGPYVARLVLPDDSLAIPIHEEPRFSSTWRGGFKEGSVRLREPLDSQSPFFDPYTKLRIDDAATGHVCFEGYLDLPGKSRSRDEGDVWDLGVVGPSGRFSDRKRTYHSIDTSFDGWKQGYATRTGKMTTGVGTLPAGLEEGEDCLLLQWPEGMAVGNADRVAMIYDRLRQTGQLAGGIQFTHREGFASTVQRTQVLAQTDFGAEDIARNQAWVITLTETAAASAGGATMGTNRNRLKLRIFRDGGSAQNIDSENWWAGITKMRVSAQRRDQDGDLINGVDSYANGYVLAHEVIIDALYWFCARQLGPDWISAIDIAGADIDTSFTHHVDQLVYMDLTDLQQVHEDLALFEPDMGWGLFESDSSGQHRYRLYRVHDGSTVAGSIESGARYLVPPNSYDSWNQPGGEDDLRNSATISWEDGSGKKQSRTFLASDFDLDVPGLDKWSILRDAEPIELANELGSEANAERIAEQVLRRAASPPVSGTLVVRGKVRDVWNGCDVDPWEIEPGYPLLPEDIDIDPLPITDIDIAGKVGTLTLSEPVLTDEQLLNQFARRRRRRG